ncbi:MAG: hypothetical protein Q7T39_07425, partial [Polaromonas sp.]|nr:hypothetical protein [Polaromonas sp.]
LPAGVGRPVFFKGGNLLFAAQLFGEGLWHEVTPEVEKWGDKQRCTIHAFAVCSGINFKSSTRLFEALMSYIRENLLPIKSIVFL